MSSDKTPTQQNLDFSQTCQYFFLLTIIGLVVSSVQNFTRYSQWMMLWIVMMDLEHYQIYYFSLYPQALRNQQS